MDLTYRTRLLQLLRTTFDEGELKDLCFTLGVDYDNLPGEGKANKARELVLFLQRQDRIPELVDIGSRLRPNESWESAVEARSDAGPGLGHSRPVGQGLNALSDLMQVPEVRNAVVAFRTDFEAAHDQVNHLGNYKDLHDLLHTLQFHCYNPILHEAKRFPNDGMALDSLADHELTLQQIIDDLREAAERAFLATAETAWIQDLVKAREALGIAIEELNPELLRRALWLLNKVLAVQPSHINTRLNASARALRLPALVEAMSGLSDNLARLDLDPDKVDQFEAGVDALASLEMNLTSLVDDHDRWQVVDLELRRIEAQIRQDLLELQMSWPDLKAMTKPLYAESSDEWAESLRKATHNLDQAITAENPVHIRRYFRRYRRQADARFYRVDVALKRLCDDLRGDRNPLTSLVRIMT